MKKPFSLGTRLQYGTLEEIEEREYAELMRQVSAERIRIARSTSRWQEIEDDLVPRGRVWLVSASTDAVYRRDRGLVFAPGSVSIVDEVRPLHFTVGDDGELTFYERERETWSAIVARRAARKPRA
jgi:hypothetical protein